MIWLPQESVGEAFLKECEKICNNEELFATFKQNYIFGKVIGNDVRSKAIADILYANLEGDDFILENISKYLENDKYGNPLLYKYPKATISPGTLYFLNILQSLRYNFGDLSKFDIVEIGGGYGGQGKIIIDSGIQSYSFIDVAETLGLCKKYIELFNHKCDYFCFPITPARDFDLVLSNWCLSEFDNNGIEFYFENVIKNCQNGFFLMNIWDERKSFLLNLANKYFESVSCIPEYPKTHENDNWTLIVKKRK